MYPIKENLKLREESEEAIGSYTFGNKNVKHSFCKQCGSSVFFEILKAPPEAVAEAEARGEKVPVIMGVNVSNVALCPHSYPIIFCECDQLTLFQLRMVTGLEVDKLIINKVDGEGREPKYAVL